MSKLLKALLIASFAVASFSAKAVTVVSWGGAYTESQQKAYADAAGKSVGELQSMLQQEKNIQLVKNGTNKEAKAALADYERLM